MVTQINILIHIDLLLYFKTKLFFSFKTEEIVVEENDSPIFVILTLCGEIKNPNDVFDIKYCIF